MRLALLGNHPDGIEMACCLAQTGRHELAIFTSSALGLELIKRGVSPGKLVNDLEEILADPSIDLVIVASALTYRAAHLRRALQSERHVICVYPPDSSVNAAYEAAMIQQDTGRVLFPLLTDGWHPGIVRLKELIKVPEANLGEIKLLRLIHQMREESREPGDVEKVQRAVLEWGAIQRLGGAIVELSAMGLGEEHTVDQPILVSGRVNAGFLFDAGWVGQAGRAYKQIVLIGSHGSCDLDFHLGDPGPCFLTWEDRKGARHEESWDIWDPWPTLVENFEAAVKLYENHGKPKQELSWGSWHDAVVAMELDESARRSLEKRKAFTVEYPEASEEVGFKGTMTLVGCGLLWLLLLLVILAIWAPWLLWVVLPVLGAFLVLQLLKGIIPGKTGRKGGDEK